MRPHRIPVYGLKLGLEPNTSAKTEFRLGWGAGD